MKNSRILFSHCKHNNTGEDEESGDKYCLDCKMLLKKGKR